MVSNRMITCDCGAQNSPVAFRCHECGLIFDGRAGNTIQTGRMLTVVGSGSGNSPSHINAFHTPIVGTATRRPYVEGKGHTTHVAIITFSTKAKLRCEPSDPRNCGPFTLYPDSSTNEAAGLRLAGKVWRDKCPNFRLNVILFGDGVPTAGGGIFGSDRKAALEEAAKLKQGGARIATIGFEGSTMDFGHLRAMASSPALAFETKAGAVIRTFLTTTQSITSNQFGNTGDELIVFVIDESGSMNEGNKKTEVEEAVSASLKNLSTLCASK